MPVADPGTAADIEFPADAIEVARVLDAWGVKGWIRVQPFAKDPQALFSSTRWFLKPADPPLRHRSGARDDELPGYLKIGYTRMQGGNVLAEVRGVEDRGAAETLRGARIFVPRHSFPSTSVDEFYWVDLIGLEVLNREALSLGRVSGLIDTGVHSVLRVAPAEAGDETLIPFVAAYVDAVDLATRQIRVDWGLDY
ncbi:MAG: ribosome maturation factor RimM [Rubrivivax sp.]